MEKKLYRVKVVLFVMAENESEARLAATRSQFDIFECTARKAIDFIGNRENVPKACRPLIKFLKQNLRDGVHMLLPIMSI